MARYLNGALFGFNRRSLKAKVPTITFYLRRRKWAKEEREMS
jgi:hypothetical protein